VVSAPIDTTVHPCPRLRPGPNVICTLVTLELQLIERTKAEPLPPEQMLQAGAQALDTYRSGR
jgi:hypothetical protein